MKFIVISLLLIMGITASSQPHPPYTYWAHWWFPWPRYITSHNLSSPHRRAKIRAARRAYKAYRKELDKRYPR